MATHALSTLALDNQENQVKIASLLVDLLLSSERIETQEVTSKCVWRIARENHEDALGIARASGVGPLVRLLRDGSPAGQQQAACAIAEVSRHPIAHHSQPPWVPLNPSPLAIVLRSAS